MGSSSVCLKKYKLYDKVELPSRMLSYRILEVYARNKWEADRTARIHHCQILRELGML